MRSGIHSRPSGPDSRFLRAGLALLLSAAVPAQAMAMVGPGRLGPPAEPGAPKSASVSLMDGAGLGTSQARIDGSVLDSFKSREKVSYLIKLRTNADVVGAAAEAAASATPAGAALAARSAVISSLKEAAASTQSALIGFLQGGQAAGKVAEYTPYWITNMIAVTSDQTTMEQIARRADVEAIYENGEIFLIKSEPATLEEEVGTLAGQPEWNIERVGAPSVWRQFNIDGTGAVVASLDTGVDPIHPALVSQYRGSGTDHTYTWYDAVNGRTAPYDDNGHGSHTVGTMVGRDASGDNLIGVAPGGQWIAAKILNSAGNGTADNILRAGQWILEPGGDASKAPDVVNNSWGGSSGMNEWFRGIVQSWRAARIVPVFANGNSGPGTGTVSVPANYPESIGVGSTDRNDGLSSFSSRGPSPYGEIKPDLSAPGAGVRSALPGNGYGADSGTSMAAPHVAGVAALLRSADASLSVDEIEEILIQTADPMTNAQYTSVPNNGYGHGIVNAYRAVAESLGMGEGRVTGRLLTQGDDLNPPTITHTPVTESFKQTNTTILAQIEDDVAVTDVYLRFRVPGLKWWGIVDMTRLSGDHKGGTYSGVIPAELSTQDSIEYYIEAVDFGNNHAYHGTSQQPHVLNLLNGLTPGYMQDFEGTAPGWITLGTPADLWQIGVPTSGPEAAYEGTQVAATNLAGDYPSNANAYLVSPPIDLSGGPAALRFQHWYNMETNWDYGYVTITNDYGENWRTLQRFTGTNGRYEEVVVDLSAYAGQAGLYLGFILTSDGSVTRPGWYIDNVELYVDTEAPDAPSNLVAQGTGSGAIALAWDPSSARDFAHYTIYRSTTAGSGYEAIGQASSPSYLDASVAANTHYYYVVTASDVFLNESGYSNEADAVAPNVTIIFHDNMENGPGAWTLDGTNNSWQWGAPTSGPGGAASGQNVWATNLSGNYPANANASLVSPPIDLSGLSVANLQFTHWYSLERKWDYGRLEISTNGGASWTQLAQYTSPASGGVPVGWESPLIDLSSYVGQTVQFRFRQTSDGSVHYPGWYIDDVIVAGAASGLSQVDRSLSVASDAPPMKEGQKPADVVEIHHPMPRFDYRVDEGALSTGIMALPAEGTITVVETGRVVRTSPADGSYSLSLPASTYTLRAESYGYYPQEKPVTITSGGVATVNFLLEEIPRGELIGTVTNGRTGAPVAGAMVAVSEDPRIAPTQTDAAGQFRLELLAGTYTVRINHANYYGASTVVAVPGNGTASIDVELRPFVGIPGELAYDDGTAENARAFNDAGNGWAVRMSSEAAVLLAGARVYFWDASWPGMGADDFLVAVYAAKADGTPGERLAGPLLIEDANLGGWTDVDLREFGVSVQGDFYVAIIQTRDYPDSPGIGFDETRETGRTWQVIDGAWSPRTGVGNVMIRAVISQEVPAPTLTAPADNSFTNQTEVTVEGRGVHGTSITIYDQGQPVAEATPGSDGTFSATLTLAEGDHVLTAIAANAEGMTTDPSAPVQITVDLTAPELSIATPEEGGSQNHRLLTVTGQAIDLHLAAVQVNGTQAQVGEDGQFIAEIIVREGENQITVTATDRAGNQSSATRTMLVDTVKPELTNLQPAADQSLKTGDSLTLSFESEPGLALAAFKIVAHLGGGGAAGEDSQFGLEPGEVAMTEVSPGLYEATFTVPDGMSLPQAYVQFRALDAAGNTTRATAPGMLQIGIAEGDPEEPGDPGEPGEPGEEPGEGPVAQITGPASIKVNQNAEWDGSQSISSSQIVAYEWNMGDGSKPTRKSSVKYKFKQEGTYTITLTITDADGNTATTSLTVEVTR